jgi:hypothetical protein
MQSLRSHLRSSAFLCGSFCLLLASGAAAAEPFRTDDGDPALPWYQLEPGVFPPANSWHAVSGELIALDHVNRTGVLRPDRDDTQRRGDWDIPRPFGLLAFGSVGYHGAPAELRDVPIGTHLHGRFYADPVVAKVPAGRKAPVQSDPATFTRVVRLDDDFSYMQNRGRIWRIEAIAADPMTGAITGLTVLDVPAKGSTTETPANVEPVTFQLATTTRVWKGRGFGEIADLAAGQTVLLNITVATLKGPGRLTDVWIDEESRKLAAAKQVEVHRQFQREHGLACWIDEVDNQAGTVTLAVFAGFDPELRKALVVENPAASAAPAASTAPATSTAQPAPPPTAALAVGEDSLRTYDQINDNKKGPILEVRDFKPTAEVEGDSYVRVKVHPSLLLEGFRPRKIVRLFAPGWKVDDLPREERLYP